MLQAVSLRLRLVPPLLLLAALSAVAAIPATAGGSSWYGDSLLVQPGDQNLPGLEIALAVGDPGSMPARVTLYAPRGFDLFPQRPQGFPVGNAEIEAFDYTAGSSGLTLLQGEISAGTLDAQTEASLQACSPRPHIALWNLTLNLLGQPLPIPIAISSAAAGDPTDAGLRLDLCTPSIVPGGTLLPISTLAMSLDGLRPPRAAGSYDWRAFVTPVAPDRTTPLPDRAFELRSVVPVPQTLTLHGSYTAKAHKATLTGTLLEAGKPAPGVAVSIIKLVRTITPSGVDDEDVWLRDVRTDRAGHYHLNARLLRTAGFTAVTRARTTACPDAGTTPGGCKAMTVAGTQSEPITLSVAPPKK